MLQKTIWEMAWEIYARKMGSFHGVAPDFVCRSFAGQSFTAAQAFREFMESEGKLPGAEIHRGGDQAGPLRKGVSMRFVFRLVAFWLVGVGLGAIVGALFGLAVFGWPVTAEIVSTAAFGAAASGYILGMFCLMKFAEKGFAD